MVIQALLLLYCISILQLFNGISAGSERPLTVPIEGKLVIPDGSSTGNYKITLNGEEYTTLCQSDGSFTFHNIPTGYSSC